MTQHKPSKKFPVLDLKKAQTILFLRRLYILKRVLPIKVWITSYKHNICLVLYQCGIRLKCYILPDLGWVMTLYYTIMS